MQRNTILLVIIAALGGFIAGFMLANSLNRSQAGTPVSSSQAPASSAKTTPAKADDELSPAEIKAKLAEADKDPTNFKFQKDLGIGLYRYASMKQAPAILSDAARILERANGLDPKDFDVLVFFGNARFDIGYANKDNKNFLAARDLYTKALEIKPADADVATDRALTYFFQEPPDLSRAAAELQKVGEANPKHERSLQFLVQALVKQNKFDEADKAIAKLKSLNPQNQAIPELESDLATARKTGK
jgi:tetratricopeptide (TPR) repeat protein